MTETEYAAAPPREHEWAVADNRDGTYDVYDLANGGTTLRAQREDGVWALYRASGVRVPTAFQPEFDPLLDLLDRLENQRLARRAA